MSRTKQSAQRELKQQYANLNVIVEKIAEFTELESPVHLITRRDKTRQRIAELEEMLHVGITKHWQSR